MSTAENPPDTGVDSPGLRPAGEPLEGLPSGPLVAFGPFRFDRARLRLFRDSEEITVPSRVVGVLGALIAQAGRVVSRGALIREVWKGSHVTETSAAEAVSLLRQALGDDAQSPLFVQTVPRRGYRFIAALTEAAPLPARAEPTPNTLDKPSPAGDSRERGPILVRSRARWLAAGGVLLALLGVLLATLLAGRGASSAAGAPAPAVRFTIRLPEGDSILAYRSSLAFSRDGRWLAIAVTRNGESRLLLRPLDSAELREGPHSAGASGPFFSPDGRSIAFFADGRLVRMPREGAPPVTIARAPTGLGGAWAEDGWIYFNRSPIGGIWRVRAEGGDSEPITRLDPSAGEVAHVWPSLLPNGGALFYTVWTATFESTRIAVQRLDGSSPRTLVERAGHAIFVPPGHLVWVGESGPMVASFDPGRLELTTPGEPLPYPVSVNPALQLGVQAISPTGALAFRPGSLPVGKRRLAFLDGEGRSEPLVLPDRFFANIAWDPVHERFAATVLDGTHSDVWIAADGAGTRRLASEGFNIEPLWSPDGRRVAFASSRDGAFVIYEQAADGSAPARVLTRGAEHRYPASWRPDGEALLFGKTNARTGLDLWLLEQSGEGWTEKPFTVSEADELYGQFSPDGRWVAYSTDRTGRREIFVLPAAGAGGPWQASFEGGRCARWSPSGDELYYLQGPDVMAVPFAGNDAPGDGNDEPRIGAAERLFEEPTLVTLRTVGRRRFLAILEHAPDSRSGEEIEIALPGLPSDD
jgi:Tol biopolymer transport system component/DNA-binding winged helix-turn-helix (wHTH) protein